MPKGAVCELNIPDITVLSNVTVGSGASLGISGPTVDGDVTGNHGAFITIAEGATIGGNVNLVGSTGNIEILQSTIGGNIQIVGTTTGTNGIEVAENTVTGNVTLVNNAVANVGVIVGNNMIGMNLTCVNNTPAPTIGGRMSRSLLKYARQALPIE